MTLLITWTATISFSLIFWTSVITAVARLIK